MAKYLLVGDPHATPDQLHDCWQLMGYVNDVARQTGATVLILGDLHDTHNVVRVEVLAFWREVFWYLKRTNIPRVAMVGNHDYAGAGTLQHALMAYDGLIDVIDRPTVMDGLLLLPYYSDNVAFVAAANAHPATTLICHQTFDGSKYESGVFAPDGVDPARVPQTQIISGHIHTAQEFGKVWYPGSPRWRSLSDANVPKAIWLVEFDESGRLLKREAFDTSGVCRQIRHAIDSPAEPIQGQLDPRCDWRVDIQGPADWIERRKNELAGPGVRVRTFKTESKQAVVRESDGIATAFSKYLGTYSPRLGTPLEVLRSMSKERLHVG